VAADIRAEVEQHPDATLRELCEHVERTKGLRSNPSMMCRELGHLKLPYKKTIHASQPHGTFRARHRG